MKMFFQLQKIDEKTGIVSGRAVEEVLDHAGEIFDYAKSKPHFEAWSQNISKATDGKSVGNVRAMHGKVAAGKLTDIVFNDAEKAIDVTAKIVDPVEKAKLLEGVYTGFSIGGSYVTKWEDPVHKGVMRYEAEPSEISIVDLPCVPTAQFTAIKADGSQELRKFHTVSGSEAAPSGDTPPVDGTATASDPVSAAAVETSQDTPSAQPDPSAAAAALSKREPFLKRAEALSKNENARGTLDALRAAYGLPEVEKGLYDVAELADLLSWLTCLADCAESESMWEGDNSKVPEDLRASVRELGAVLLEMAREEIAEAVGDEAGVMEMAAKIGELTKRDDNTETVIEVLKGIMAALVEKFPPQPPAPAGLSKVQRAVLDETTHALSKARAENEELKKRVDELMKLPAAKAPVLRVVGKGDDNGTPIGSDTAEADIKPVMVAGKEDAFATKIKKLRAQQLRGS